MLFRSLALFLQFVSFSTAYGFTPIIAENLGATDAEKGLVTTIYSLTAVIGALANASLGKKYRLRGVLVGSFLLQGVLCALLPFLGDIYLLYGVQIVLGFFRGMLLSLLMSLSIERVSPEKQGTAMGFFQAVYSVGMTVGPLFIGLVGDAAGLETGFVLTGAISVGIAAFAWRARLV